MSSLTISRFKAEAQANHDAAYFVDALAKFIDIVGTYDPCLCEKALDGYVVGGLVTGLRQVASEMMNRNCELIDLLEKQELATQTEDGQNVSHASGGRTS